ncbi:MAG: MoxR family ATPase, partial [Clostridiales bacterium]|nr:MoxR family ATPase [Candidatus Blautia equi]
MNELQFLYDQQVDAGLIEAVEEFRCRYDVAAEEQHRVNVPSMPFYGKDILEMSIAAILEGENLLLTGPKATGKNVLAENLAYIFGRPSYNVSFHVNTNSGDLIGTDTFVDNQVKFRKGTIYRCAEYGGFGILDEINMAKNDAVSVLHATLDYRRTIDVPGYDKIDLHPAARFIGTMNYGYAGTKELNEALVSRFMVIDMPAQTEESLNFIFHEKFPNAKSSATDQFIGVFL